MTDYLQKKAGEPLDYRMIDKAVTELYGGWQDVSEYTKSLLQVALKTENLSELFEEQLREESAMQDVVLQRNAHDVSRMRESNVNEIIKLALEKRKNN